MEHMLDRMVFHPKQFHTETSMILYLNMQIEYTAISILIDGKKPTQWSSCDILPIPKAGNLNEFISLLYRLYLLLHLKLQTK